VSDTPITMTEARERLKALAASEFADMCKAKRQLERGKDPAWCALAIEVHGRTIEALKLAIDHLPNAPGQADERITEYDLAQLRLSDRTLEALLGAWGAGSPLDPIFHRYAREVLNLAAPEPPHTAETRDA
jgi:hypothetical protein